MWAELHQGMYYTLDFSLMKAAGAFSLPPPYHTVKPACLLPHCTCQRRGSRSLMPASWKWVTAPCHVADLYPGGALCSENLRTRLPSPLPLVDIQRRDHDCCSYQIEEKRASAHVEGGEVSGIGGIACPTRSSASCRVWCLFYKTPSPIWIHWTLDSRLNKMMVIHNTAADMKTPSRSISAP